jgi:WD40 repeat protein
VIASAIRELATSKSSTIIAAGMFKTTVQLWDLTSQVKICEIPTVFCTGAKNLALSPTGEMLVAGLSLNHGKVAAYEIPTGRKIWEHSLCYPSSLHFHPSGQSLLCTRNNQSVLRLDIQTGSVMEVVKEVSSCIEEPSSGASILYVERGDEAIRIIRRDHGFSFAKTGFALLDAQFSPHFVCVSEARGLVRCINLIDGTLRWKFDPGKGSHVLRLHYSSGMDLIFGILRNFEMGGPRTLIRFNPANGTHERVCELDSWEEIFLETVDQLVTSAGEIRDLSSGFCVGRLDFPMREYRPDV